MAPGRPLSHRRASRSSTSAIARAPIPTRVHGRDARAPRRATPIAHPDAASASASDVPRRRSISITMRARTWDDASSARRSPTARSRTRIVARRGRAREAMIEAIAELDDELMAAWVAGRELPPDERSAPRCAASTLAGRGVPTLVGAAFRNKGIHNLLDAVARLPAVAGRRPAVRGRDPRSRRRRRRCRARPCDDQPLAALAFKVQIDDAGGQLTFVRVYAGMPARRRRGAQRDQGQPRAHRPAGAHAREPPRGHPPDRGRHDRRGPSGRAASSPPATRCATRARRSCSTRCRRRAR